VASFFTTVYLVTDVLMRWLEQGVNFSAAFYYDIVNPTWMNHGSRTSETSDDKSVNSHPSSSEVGFVSSYHFVSYLQESLYFVSVVVALVFGWFNASL